MMRQLLFASALIFSSFININCQDYWQKIISESESQVLIEQSDLKLIPSSYTLYRLKDEPLKQTLLASPMERSKKEGAEVLVPTPDGIRSYKSWEAPVMAKGLAAKYPQIRTFAIKGSKAGEHGRIGFTHKGSFAYIQSAEGLIELQPINTDSGERYYICYYHDDLPEEELRDPGVQPCGVTNEDILKNGTQDEHTSRTIQPRKGGSGVQFLSIYRLAIASTGELTQFLGGTKADVNAYFAELLSISNMIYQTEVAVKLELINKNDSLIFLDGLTDPYPQGNNLEDIINRNQSAFASVGIDQSEYDVGHAMINLRMPGTIGLAGGQTCSNAANHKSRGASAGNFYNSIARTAIELFSHEIGHQFICGHSWNNCPPSQGQRSTSNAYEPGGGTTIMSYSGSCGGANNIQFLADPYYNIGSLEDFIGYSRDGFGSFCNGTEITDNGEAEVNIPIPDGLVIPINTPFELEAIGSDPDGDAITYCWEQFDLGPAVDLGVAFANSPLFRSFPPVPDSIRVFPNIEDLIDNRTDRAELLPFYSRKLTFTCTVRDNNMEAGSTVWDVIELNSSELAGPFIVESPNTGGESWAAGSRQMVTWDVANTDEAPVNAKFVDIYLSTDNGFTYSHQLAARVPNTGQAMISVPDVETALARIKVKGYGNVFFDISNEGFTIERSQPGYFFSVFESGASFCSPDVYTFDIETESILGYDSLVSLNLASVLPVGVNLSISKNPFIAGEDIQVTLAFEDVNMSDNYILEWELTAPDLNTYTFETAVDVTSSDFSDLEELFPSNGLTISQQSPVFRWRETPNATSYTFELASDPSFEASTIIQRNENLTEDSVQISSVLNKGQLYFWRIKATNDCSDSGFDLPIAFAVRGQACIVVEANDIPISISGNGTPTITSELEVGTDAVTNDINVVNLKGNHDRITNIDVTLEGPDGNSIDLFKRVPCPVAPFDLNLDDDASVTVNCADINSGKTLKPQGSLSEFYDKNAKGIWKLRVSVNDNFGNGGFLEGWGLELCGEVSFLPPVLVRNDTLRVRKGKSTFVSNDFLLTTDDDSPDTEIIYTLVTVPTNGELLLDSEPLAVGDKFSQFQVAQNRVVYEHQDTMTDADSYVFVVDDRQGGLITNTRMHIVTDPDAVLSAQDVSDIASKVNVFPNPARDYLSLTFEGGLKNMTTLQLYDINGRILRTVELTQNQQSHELSLTGMQAGVYIVKLQNENGQLSKRIIVQP